MNITVLELTDDVVRMVIIGQGHTFLNALTNELLQDPVVDVATYLVEFQFSDPVLTVTTHDMANPVEAVKRACQRVSGACADLLTQLESAV
ncbi:MAG: DNA-directed RNA polymerase subunit L [Methanospirillaceae archaeon]|nr:DNA-directed RNA polymerase subunit L [Methanospirillaceae archaeon]